MSQDEQELAIAVAAARSTTSVVQSLVEAVSPNDPRYENICGSKKTPEALWQGIFGTIFSTMHTTLKIARAERQPKSIAPVVRGKGKKPVSSTWKTQWDKPQ